MGSIPLKHPWLLHGIRLSMLHHVLPILYYDIEQETLILKKSSKKQVEVDSTIKRYILRHLYMLRIPFDERGPFYDDMSDVYMSLSIEGGWELTEKDLNLFDTKT